MNGRNRTDGKKSVDQNSEDVVSTVFKIPIMLPLNNIRVDSGFEITRGYKKISKQRILLIIFFSEMDSDALRRMMYLRREYTSILAAVEDYQGIVFTPQLHTDEHWTGIIFIRSEKSPWYKGAFTFHVHFPPRYPFDCPTATFELPLHSHPLLQATEGRIIPFDAEYLSLDPMHVSVMARLLKFIRRLFLPQEWCFLHTDDNNQMLGRPNVDLRLLQKDMELRTVSQEVLLRKPYVEYLTMEAREWILQHLPLRVKYEEEDSAASFVDEREVESTFTGWLLRTFIPYAKNLS